MKKDSLSKLVANISTGAGIVGVRDGIELDKGVVLTEDKIRKNRKLFEQYCSYFTAYPDMFLLLITPTNSNFQLFFYQVVYLRASLRYRKIFVVAPRAFSKTFIAILALFLKCIFQPNIKLFICAPHINQAAKIATEKIKEIYGIWPLLQREVIGIGDQPGNFGKDYVKLSFKNGSLFDVVGAVDTTRGNRRNSGLIDELRKIVL